MGAPERGGFDDRVLAGLRKSGLGSQHPHSGSQTLHLQSQRIWCPLLISVMLFHLGRPNIHMYEQTKRQPVQIKSRSRCAGAHLVPGLRGERQMESEFEDSLVCRVRTCPNPRSPNKKRANQMASQMKVLALHTP